MEFLVNKVNSKFDFLSLSDENGQFCFGYQLIIPDRLPIGEVDLDLALQGRRDDLPKFGVFRGERLEVGPGAVRIPRVQERVQGHVLHEKRSLH